MINCSGVDDNIGEEVEDDDDVLLPPTGAASGSGGAPGEQARGAGAPKYYSLQNTSVATNSGMSSTVRRGNGEPSAGGPAARRDARQEPQ